MNRGKLLIVIAGPTAVGKTDLALRLARKYQTEIISADSRQIYRELTIGTAKPSEAELMTIQHHFINERSVGETFTAADFEKEALERLESIYREHDLAVMVGGTGLYLHALLFGLAAIPEVEQHVREKYETLYQQEGIDVLQDLIRLRDPVFAASADIRNPRRLVRALSVWETTGRPFSSFHHQAPAQRSFLTLPILLDLNRENLYERINRRVDQMIEAGLEGEVSDLYPYRHTQALQTVGYQEWFPYFEGKYDREEAIRLIKQNSRRYAKRQGTWFRKYGEWNVFDAADLLKVQELIIQQVHSAMKLAQF